MSIKVFCAPCGSAWVAPARAAGRRTKCPKCRAPLQVPASPPAAEEEVLEVLPADAADHDVLAVVEEPTSKRTRRGTGLLSRREFLIEGRAGSFNKTVSYDLLDPDSEDFLGSVCEKGAAQSALVAWLTPRSNVSSVIEVCAGDGDDLVFAMDRPSRLFNAAPTAQVYGARGELLGSVRNLLTKPARLEVDGPGGEALGDVETRGKKLVFVDPDGRTFGSVVWEAVCRPGALPSAARGGRFVVTARPELDDRPDLKALLLAAGLYLDISTLDQMAAMTYARMGRR
jgi:hypothetical protein